MITAWNPGGRRVPAHLNERAQSALRRRWAGTALDGVNGEGPWAEPALILLDLPLAQALGLGRDFGQAAVLYGVGRRVALVWLDTRTPDIERHWLRAAGGAGGPV